MRRRLGGVVIVAVAVCGLTACGGGPEFAEGDCVTIKQKTLDSELEKASCEGAVGTFDDAERVYRVDSIIDGVDGTCPPLQGFFPVQFVDEPANTTYCLVQADGA